MRPESCAVTAEYRFRTCIKHALEHIETAYENGFSPFSTGCQVLIADGLLPVKRFGQPEDVARMVLACASGLLDYSAGQVLDADGGFCLRRL